MSHPPLQVILLGPPGAGKGTQATRLAHRLGLAHINPGQILRETASNDSPSGRRIRAVMAAGDLVDDDVTDQLVSQRLESLAPEQGFVLDGYPRTPGQARALREMLMRQGRLVPPPIVVWLQVPRDQLVGRLRRRGSEQHRQDDSDDAIIRRLEIYDSQAAALRTAFEGWTNSVSIDGSQPPDAITEDIVARLRAGTQDARRSRSR
jgi:adenylate kinase